MSDCEPIMLIGGPVDGKNLCWDGGDYVKYSETPHNTFTAATKNFSQLLIKDHTYKRDRRLVTRNGDAVFVWTGEPK